MIDIFCDDSQGIEPVFCKEYIMRKILMFSENDILLFNRQRKIELREKKLKRIIRDDNIL